MDSTKVKLIRVLQIISTTNKDNPINTSQIIKLIKENYNIEKINRKSIYNDITILIECGYNIVKCKDGKKGWYLDI